METIIQPSRREATELAARRIVRLLRTKPDAVLRLAASVPASILQMHPAAKVFLDEAAAIRLERADYYRSAYAGKPDWQR